MGLNIDEVEVPVVGGHAGVTILPLFSQVWNRILTSAHLNPSYFTVQLYSSFSILREGTEHVLSAAPGLLF